MPESKLISPNRIAKTLRNRAKLAIDSANWSLQHLKDNRITWLNASDTIDGLRREIRTAALVLSELVEWDEYTELGAILGETLQSLDAIGAVMTKDYLLNGPKAVAA